MSQLKAEYPSSFTDYLNIFWGGFNGGVDALPETSLVTLCKNNITESPDTFWDIVNYWNSADYHNSVQSAVNLFDYPHYITFNCYYSVFIVISVDTYSGIFGTTEILLNILFNLGYMYESIKNIVIYDKTLDDTWYKMGYYGGDVLMRFFYRE